MVITLRTRLGGSFSFPGPDVAYLMSPWKNSCYSILTERSCTRLGAGRRAVHQAMADVFGDGHSFDGVRFDGKTDPQIVTELLRETGRDEPPSDEVIDAVCERYLGYLEEELTAGRRQSLLYPGVQDLLGRLEGRSDTVIGLLTGNLERGAHLKLRFAGLEPGRFRVGAYGSDAPHRPDLPPIAAARASQLMGRVPTGAEVVIIGDTPSDVTCGISIRARAIGVATGHYVAQDLQSAGAYAVFEDLADPIAVESAIFA